ncbi:Histone-lysine N-methyltransferase SETMAR [Eumeta japonica]|uniref:Histone-lysine N-methyltransferase SETMAR n=1 Tax=Eumeta variegata TaxID=151549 RepID=A0A4C1VJF8_EUMVA|nr:Histone-lysine N-methyltransferase SETMAR [Eumeta japonica]
MEANPSQTASELAACFGVRDKTILIHLKQIGKVKNLGKWVPHELSEAHQQTCIECRLHHSTVDEGTLKRIVTCDENEAAPSPVKSIARKLRLYRKNERNGRPDGDIEDAAGDAHVGSTAISPSRCPPAPAAAARAPPNSQNVKQ